MKRTFSSRWSEVGIWGGIAPQTEGWYQIVPNRHYENAESEEEFAERYPCAYSYFSNYRDLLTKRSTHRRYQKHLPFYVIYCVGDYSFKEWKVIWMEQQDPAQFRCAVISDDPSSLVPNKQMIPDHKLYFASVAAKEEAHFLAAYLNSHPVRTWLGGFLHGKQIATTVFEFMHVPLFDNRDPEHQRLVEISLAALKQRAGGHDRKLLAEQHEQDLAALVHRVAAKR